MTTTFLKGLDFYLKQTARILGVGGLLLYDYLASGLVIYLVIGGLLQQNGQTGLGVLLFLLSAGMSISLSAVAQSVLDRLMHKKLKVRSFTDLFELAIGGVFIFLDVFIDGMIAPYLLYGESPMMYFRYIEQGAPEFVAMVIFLRLFSLISEPGVVILTSWELKNRVPVTKSNTNTRNEPKKKKHNNRQGTVPKRKNSKKQYGRNFYDDLQSGF